MKNLLLTLTTLLLTTSIFAGNRRVDTLTLLENSAEFSTLLTAIKVAGLEEAIEDSRRLTILAPTDEAFSKLPEGTLDTLIQNPEALKDILLYHVADRKLTERRVISNNGVPTLLGKFVTLSVRDGSAYLNEAQILETNIRTRNAIIHKIDSVLVPTEETANNEIETAQNVDLERYQGLWYEITKFPNRFERGCFDVTAEYSLRRDGRVNVFNTCVREDKGPRTGKGIARIVNRETNATLGVSFAPIFKYFGLFTGDYNILALDQDYQYVLVGSQNREFLWILSRVKDLDESTILELTNIARLQGYDISRLERTPTLEN